MISRSGCGRRKRSGWKRSWSRCQSDSVGVAGVRTVAHGFEPWFFCCRKLVSRFKGLGGIIRVVGARDRNAGVLAGWIGCVLAAEWEACAGILVTNDIRGFCQ